MICPVFMVLAWRLLLSAVNAEEFVQYGADIIGANIGGDECLAYAVHQNQMQTAILHLFVAAHMFDQRIPLARTRRQLAGMGRQAVRRQVAGHAQPIGGIAETHPGRQAKRQNDADTDRLAVQQRAAIAAFGFERMGKGVAEIEQRAVAAFALIFGDDTRLGAATFGNGMAPGSGITATITMAITIEDRPTIGLEPGVKFGIVNQAVFDHFAVTGGQFARRQGIKRNGIGEHQARLVKAADQVFTMATIDSGLAADGAIDLRQQAGR
jgi:hypothetical protein